MGDHVSPQLASLGPRGKDGSLRTRAGPDLTLCTTPEVMAIFSASSTVLVATLLTLLTTASLTALACSLVFSATVGELWVTLALTPPYQDQPAPGRPEQPFTRALKPLALYPRAEAAPSQCQEGSDGWEANPGF